MGRTVETASEMYIACTSVLMNSLNNHRRLHWVCAKLAISSQPRREEGLRGLHPSLLNYFLQTDPGKGGANAFSGASTDPSAKPQPTGYTTYGPHNKIKKNHEPKKGTGREEGGLIKVGRR